MLNHSLKEIEKDFISLSPQGLYCPQANLHIDPWSSVENSINTHAHRDHISFGCGSYLCSEESKGVLGIRVGKDQKIEGLPYAKKININGVTISFHPAGHIIGSSQILLEFRGKKLVITGDYKLEKDKSCTAFEPVQCDTLITECTFGMPVFNWSNFGREYEKLVTWWKKNKENNIVSVVYAYPLGKSQRILSMLADVGETVFIHRSLKPYVEEYEKLSVKFPNYEIIGDQRADEIRHSGLIIVPNGLANSKLIKSLGNVSEAQVSGWVSIRGLKRRRGVDRGFVISDHVDWAGLQKSIVESRAEKVIFTHGFTEVCSRYAKEQGLDSTTIETRFGVEDEKDEGVT